MKFLYVLSLLPLGLAIPQPKLQAQRDSIIVERAFGGSDSVGGSDVNIDGKTIADEKDTSTLTSLVVFKPSSTISSTPLAASASSSSSSAEEDDDEESQIVSPFYHPTNDDEDDKEETDTTTSIQSIGQGETPAFQPTASTTSTFLSNSLAISTTANTGTYTKYTGTANVSGTAHASGAVVAAASGGSSTSSSLRSIGMPNHSNLVGLGSLVGLIVLGLL
ncbi:uncharacterized protein L201_004613 [Kwoniella dendrophila CBS 6074]|uniref:Uncharacterized protein n=1 Tax=Kwoniella dendrophila CBS 6074 TaxID=1295534 RepID=A0AAX4JXT7_9TREE